MKYLFINTVADYGSTGTIVTRLAGQLAEKGNEVVIASGRTVEKPLPELSYYHIGGKLSTYSHIAKTRIFDRCGFGSAAVTARFLRWAENYAPDVVWLHNLHGYYIHIGKLFEWIKSRPQMKVYWTFHDCWAFTGHCTHFSYVGCSQWQTHCKSCSQRERYPKSVLADNSFRNFEEKKRAFTGVEDLTLYPVSGGMENLVKQSFLSEYPTEVHYNEADRTVFCYRESSFRAEYGLDNKIIVLGVAGKWNDRKGLYDFYELAGRLPSEYRIVLVGLTEAQRAQLPSGILGIPEVRSAERLAEIYSAADIYVNLSKQESFGMTTLEAHCCGTPVIVYKGTACEEIAAEYGETAVEQSLDAVEQAVRRHFENG